MKIERLSLCRKFSYALGGMPYMMFINILGLFITPFLLEQAQIKPIQMSIILFAAKGWDAITDPVVGVLVSKTKTRFGKYRPWIIFSTPFIIFTYMMIWYVPDISGNKKMWWYLVFYCGFQLSLTCQRVPYISFTMLLTPNQRERDSATGYRSIFEMFGTLLAVLIQGVMITVYGRKVSCETSYSSNSTLNSTQISEKYNKLNEGYLLTAGISCAFCLICSSVTFFGTKEIKEEIVEKNVPSLSAFKSILLHKPYITLLIIYSLYCICIQIMLANTALFCKYALLGGKHDYQYVLGMNFLSSIISVPIIRFAMQKLGKKNAYSVGALLFIPALIMISFLKQMGWKVYLAASIIGYSATTNFLLPWSMLPNVIDDYFLKTGHRHESFFYAFFLFSYKIIGGIVLSISGAILGFAGFIDCPNGCCDQPDSVGLALRFLMVPGPIVMLCICLFFLWKHPIDQKKLEENNELLFQLRNSHLITRL